MTAARLLGVIAAVAAVALAGCSTISKVSSVGPFHKRHVKSVAKGVRIPIIAPGDTLAVSDALKGQDFFLPAPTALTEWPLPGGTPSQSVENVEAAPAFQVAWRRTFGAPTKRGRYVIAPPIAAGGRIFVMDGGATISALDAATGARIWRTDIMPKSKRDHEAWGGGLAFDSGKIYASSGFREVVQLDAATGAIGWRTPTEAPVHAAPTVFAGRVYVADVNDELFAFDEATGVQAWTYQALTELARILAASSPAADNETVVASFASGELVALRAANGNELWNASLSRANRTNALSEIRDIAGRPVIYKGDVYAVSHSDVFAAVDLRTGTERWTLPVSAFTSPWPAGDVVFVVDDVGRVICASRESGGVYWIRDLNAGRKKKQIAYWSSPLMAGSHLVIVSSKGEAVALDPKNGSTLRTLKLGSDALIGPIAVNGVIYVVTEAAQLIAIREDHGDFPMVTLAIVGRPNVGKSTLFNRLAGRRLAIVDDRPGVTRDRKFATGRLGDLDLDLIDTAGFEDVTDESLEARMRRQTELAVAQAQVVLFVIDAREGVVPLDELFAQVLRRSGKSVILVANKSEGRAGESGGLEGYNLGLGEPVAVSAEHGEGLGDLFAAVLAKMPADDAPDDDEERAPGDKPVRMAIVGRPNAGKSTLINRLIGEDRLLTGPEAGITRDAVSVDWDWQGRRVRLVDTAGLRRKARIEEKLEKLSTQDTLRAITFAEVVVLVMDATHPFETQDLQIADLVEREGRALVFVLAKWDLVEDPGARLRAFIERAAEMLPQLRGAPVVHLSAETGRGLDRLMPAVIKTHGDWSTKLKTRDLNDWLKLAVERHPPPAVNGRRVKPKYMAQTKARPPTFVLFASRADKLPDSYRRYLVNSLRQSFDLPGTPIRITVKSGANPYAEETNDPVKAFQAKRRRARTSSQ